MFEGKKVGEETPKRPLSTEGKKAMERSMSYLNGREKFNPSDGIEEVLLAERATRYQQPQVVRNPMHQNASPLKPLPIKKLMRGARSHELRNSTPQGSQSEE